jgi:hypothetical protein
MTRETVLRLTPANAATSGLIALIPIRANVAGGDPLESYYVQQAFNGQRLHFPNFHQRGDSVAFGLNEISEDVEKAIRTAVANADTQVAHLRRIRLQQAQTHAQFAAKIREHFGPPSVSRGSVRPTV